jgi:hypothetical protein
MNLLAFTKLIHYTTLHYIALHYSTSMNYDSSNPILSSRSFSYVESDSVATLSGTISRCLILLALVLELSYFHESVRE